jgi:hypothetical protein
MQERGDPDSDENEEFIAGGMTPNDMGVGPPVCAPVTVGDAARCACDKRALDKLCDKLRAEARVRADVHRQSASAGVTGGAVSWH